ncbi:MAG TPA: immunoglobulin-like domain-containing protein, partial [Kineosporiaceae bacterium]
MHRRIPSRPGPHPDGRTPRPGRFTAVCAAAAVALGLAVVPVALGAPAAAATPSGAVLVYPLDETSGSTVSDSSGNGRTATVQGAASWGGPEGLWFNGTDTAIKLPDNVMAGLTSITVATDVWLDPDQATPYFIYGLGNSSAGAGNGYLFTTGDGYRTSIATGNWSTEQKTSASRNLPRGTWGHLAYTLTGGTAVLYLDGVEVGRTAGVTITPGAIGNGTTTSNVIGRSLYASDKPFTGRIRDFRIYDHALTADEVAALAVRATTEAVTADAAALTLGDTSAVSANLTLPATGAGGSTIAWASSAPSVVSATGVVTRPATGSPNGTATLTATLTRGKATTTKAFTVTVLSLADDPGVVKAAAAALAVPGLDDVRGNLTLPVTGSGGTSVSWTSSNPAVVTGTGEVHRPAPGSSAVTVTLTATVTLDAASATRDLTATVPALPAPAALEGYLFSYFTGEGTADGEQVYFGLSRGNDPLHWQDLNGGKPVLVSTLGEKGLRDPFVIRSPEGDKFYQIATDLRIYGNGNWDAAQRTGSKSIMVWESTDLVHWTDQRLVRVSPDSAGNTWAPEAFYDPTLGAYVVFWASTLYDNPAHTGDTYNRMMYATTRDFRTFSEPKVWIDRGWSVIDSTMIKDAGTYYRFSKDERNNTSSTPNSKFVFEEKSSSVLGSYAPVVEGIGKGVINAGEGPLVFKDNTAAKWHLFIDEFGGRGYVPFESTDLASGTWTPSTGYALPTSPRHGTVLPVTRAEYERLLAAYAPGQLVTSAAPVTATTSVGVPPVLPATVSATYADGSTRATAVTWDAVPTSAYAGTGTFTVSGTLPGSVGVRASATVTVQQDPIPVQSLTVTPTAVRLGVGVTRALTATVLPANASARTLTWTSSAPGVATVSPAGVVTTVAAGTAQITARTSDGSRSVTVPVEVTTDIPTHLVLHYTFDDTGGTLVPDASGRGNDGAYVNSPTFSPGVHGGAVTLAGGASGAAAPYVTIPNGVLRGVSDITVAAWVKWSGGTANQWLFGLGPDSNRYLFLSPQTAAAGALYAAATTGSWSAENKLTGPVLPTGSWQHVAVAIDSTAHTGTLYLNGSVVATATNVTVKPSAVDDPGKNYGGYVGRSLYGADPFFAGSVDDFRIYDQALSAADVAALAGRTASIVAATVTGLKV